MLGVRTDRLGLLPAAQALLARRTGNSDLQAGEILAVHALACTGNDLQLGNDAQVSQILSAILEERGAVRIRIHGYARFERLADGLGVARALERLVDVVAEGRKLGPLVALLLREDSASSAAGISL